MTAEQTLRRAALVVARAERMPVGAVLEPEGRRARAARHLAAYLAVTVGGVPGRRVAAAAGVTRRAVRRALARVEEDRDDPGFDRFISTLEDRYAQGL